MAISIQVLLLVVVAMAAVFDLRTRRIPNWLNLAGIITGFGINALAGRHGIASAAAGLLFSLLIYVPLYLVRGMGAGDVKLMAAVGAIAGPVNWIGIFLLTALVGGFASVVLILAKRRWRQTLSNLYLIITELVHRRAPVKRNERLDIRNNRALRMPHGAFICSGAMLFLFFLWQGWAL